MEIPVVASVLSESHQIGTLSKCVFICLLLCLSSNTIYDIYCSLVNEMYLEHVFISETIGKRHVRGSTFY